MQELQETFTWATWFAIACAVAFILGFCSDWLLQWFKKRISKSKRRFGT